MLVEGAGESYEAETEYVVCWFSVAVAGDLGIFVSRVQSSW